MTVAVVAEICQCFLSMNEVRSSTETVNLYPYGDRELWYAQGEDWSLPLFVLWHEDKTIARHWALIEPCFSLYNSQHLLMTKLFEAHDALGTKDRWLILKPTCEAMLTKAPGVTPERYYKWPDCKLRPLPAWKPISYSPEHPNGVGEAMIREDNRAFVGYVAESSNIPSSVVRIVLEAVADAAPRWMLEKRKPVDLGFCRILAAPFRGNWKEIISFKLGASKLLSLFSNYRNGELMKELESVGLPEVMTSPHNIGLRARRIDYVLEVTPAPRFEKFANEFSHKVITLGHSSHVQHYEQMVENLYADLVEALRYYIKKVSTPFARVSHGFGSGLVRLLPAVRKTFKSRRLPLADLPQRIIPTTSRFSIFSEQDKLELVQAKITALPEMSGTPSQTLDLRGCHLAADVECFPGRDDAPGTAGVSLLDASQKPVAGQSMLPGSAPGDGDASGLDGEGNP